jgi:hypothetical protein
MFAVAIAEANMGRATAGASQIYCVVRPERPSGARVQRGFSVHFIIFFIYYYFPIRFYLYSQNKIFLF